MSGSAAACHRVIMLYPPPSRTHPKAPVILRAQHPKQRHFTRQQHHGWIKARSLPHLEPPSHVLSCNYSNIRAGVSRGTKAGRPRAWKEQSQWLFDLIGHASELTFRVSGLGRVCFVWKSEERGGYLGMTFRFELCVSVHDNNNII